MLCYCRFRRAFFAGERNNGVTSSSAGDLAPVVEFFNSLFKSSSVLTVAIIILSISQIIGGFFLITELFTTDLRITDMILVILIILWIINIVLVDFVGPFEAAASSAVPKVFSAIWGRFPAILWFSARWFS